MLQFASTAGGAASFDFFTNVITLKVIPASQFWRVEQFMRNRNVFAAGGQLAREARSDKAILVHEVTHFIDATTSLWGLEYNARKTLATQLLTQGKTQNKEYQKIMRVFILNTAEIDAHKRYTRQHQPAVSLCECSMHHRLDIIEGYGPMVTIEYQLNGSVIIEVPLSMLSLLEAHAYANETLSMIFDAETLNDVAERSTIMSEIEKNYTASLSYQGAIEYIMLLQLIERGFPELDLKYRLCFFAAIARIALDADALQMSTFAQHIAPTFIPSSAATSTILDMLRGLSRAVFAFKSIFALNGMLSLLDPLSHAQVVTDMKADCFGTVRRLLTATGLLVPPISVQVERGISLSPIEQDGFLHDKIIIPESVRLNTALVNLKTCAEMFDQLTLPDAIDPSGKNRLQFSKRINVAVTNIKVNQTLPFTRLYGHITSNPQSRFFV